MGEIWPPSWLQRDMLKLVMAFIRRQALSGKQKKHMLYEWCVLAEVEMTAKMVAYVTAPPEVKIRERGIRTGVLKRG